MKIFFHFLFRELLSARLKQESPASFEEFQQRSLSPKKSGFTENLSQLSPDWVPDDFALDCMICSRKFTLFFRLASQFSIIMLLSVFLTNLQFMLSPTFTDDSFSPCRRHHCRRCGKCVCEGCAPKVSSLFDMLQILS